MWSVSLNTTTDWESEVLDILLDADTVEVSEAGLEANMADLDLVSEKEEVEEVQFVQVKVEEMESENETGNRSGADTTFKNGTEE